MFADFSALTTQQWLIIAVIVGACFSVSVWAILDVWKRRFESVNEKVLWMQIAIFLPLIGALAYILIGKKRGSRIQ